MISFVHMVKQKQTRKRERERESDQLGRSADQSSKLSSERAVVPKRLIQLLARCWLPNILRTFSQNKFMVGRNEIHRRVILYSSLNESTIVAL